jgi:hypothetical protein
MNGVDQRKQAVTGLIPPQMGEAVIRETWPSLNATNLPGAAALTGLATLLSDTIVLRPVAWLLLLPFFVAKIAPVIATYYRLSNQRLGIVRFGWSKPFRDIALQNIEDVRIDPATNNTYFRSATLDIISQGKVALQLPGVAEPESFRLAILNACKAWAPIHPKGVMPSEKDAKVQGPR